MNLSDKTAVGDWADGRSALSEQDAVAAEQAAGSATPALALGVQLGLSVPSPGSGHTWERWAVLATLSAIDLTVGRAVEAHLDALAILAESDVAPDVRAAVGASDDSSWGVFAAEGPQGRLTATGDNEWHLSGIKPWCSLADRLSHALVTAHTDQGRRLFAVALTDPGVTPEAGTWVSRGLADIPSGPVRFEAVPAVPVGEAGWYLERSGFAWGGIGVAACWFGGAAGLARSLVAAAGRREPDQVGQMHLGAVDAALFAAQVSLRHAAEAVDAGRANHDSGALLALRVRQIVADATEDVLIHAAHALGPAPLTQDEDFARRVADLQVYVRQHHGERDLAALGRMLIPSAAP